MVVEGKAVKVIALHMLLRGGPENQGLAMGFEPDVRSMRAKAHEQVMIKRNPNSVVSLPCFAGCASDLRPRPTIFTKVRSV